MTESQRESRKKLLLPLVFLTAMVFILFHAKESRLDLQEGLRLCAENVVPSLFPHLVLSELFVSNLTFSEGDSLFSRLFTRFFRLPSASAPIMLIGAICGFPIGARLSAKLCREGFLTQREAEILCAYANNTGPAFVISGVGAALFGSVRIGLFFFLAEILASLFCMLLSSFFRPKIKKRAGVLPPCKPSSFVESVRSSSFALVNICGFVLFFSLVTGMLCRAFSSCSLLISSFLEVTNACKTASLFATNAPKTASVFASFAIGFGGLSAAMQSALCMKEGGLSFALYLPRKLLQGILSVFFFFLLTEVLAI